MKLDLRFFIIELKLLKNKDGFEIFLEVLDNVKLCPNFLELLNLNFLSILQNYYKLKKYINEFGKLNKHRSNHRQVGPSFSNNSIDVIGGTGPLLVPVKGD